MTAVTPIAGVRGAQAYLVDGPDGPSVIDPGYTGSHRAVLRALDRASVRHGDLRWIILTHHHIDHAGAAFALCTATGASLAVHRADAPYLNPGRPRELMTLWGLADHLPARLARYVVAGAPCELRLLEDGDVVAGLRVLHAPGHTPGSICLHAEHAGVLFLGDVLNNERGIRRPPWNVNHSHSLAREAPHRLRGLVYQHAYFGHGAPIREAAAARIDAFLDRAISPGRRTGSQRRASPGRPGDTGG